MHKFSSQNRLKSATNFASYNLGMASSKVVVVSTNPDLPRASPISSSPSSFHPSYSNPSPKKPTTMDKILNNIYPATVQVFKRRQKLKQEPQEHQEHHQQQREQRFLFSNTDDVWTDIVAAGTTPYQPHQYQYPYQPEYQYQQHHSSDEGFSACTDGDNTLEDFLVKAGALPFSRLPQYSSSSEPSPSLDDVVAMGKRKAVEEAVDLDKAALQKQKRMIKNRESAARSRERKQAYTNELERVVKNLETENKLLTEEEEERKKERLKQLKELVFPITEQRQNRRLRRSNSM